ncbi:pyridine nucleotide-disulfide oxidoreductase [Brachybacterium endophyticum]|uniref:Pyridine nucleotide-disulfide oxidoreductase n=1 Tax=Brachybacterium endophyticum TaxID=2182385 RepID=A0A2U2RKP3_9MICO|nr:NAD(P)/FAD-dependent oxidoreductase [Brachybacterium endophyticum]PWH06354.1 pyridine nucleotide-disulfide oxidoreductase [Brachybacterium endophyticum]
MNSDAPSTAPSPSETSLSTARNRDPDLEVDVIVIGAGPVGENVAQYAIESTGLSAAIVEGELLGGECSYWACIPSKALLRPIDVQATAANLPGVSTPRVEVDELLARRDTWVSEYDDSGQAQWAEGAGIHVVRGHGRLGGERTVIVARADGADREQVLRARLAVVIATGSEAVIPDVFAQLAPWTSRDATGVREVPSSLLIIGGGVVASEAATWMRALGSEVTMLVRGESLLRGVEPEAARFVQKDLENAGVRVVTGAEVREAKRPDAKATGTGRVHGGSVQVSSSAGDFTAAEVLVATGRRPRLDDVGLEPLGLSADDVSGGALPDWLHAVGDASGEAPLTHWGKYRARVIGEEIRDAALADTEPTPPPAPAADGRAVPQVVFTDPQVASVGLTEAQAQDAGFETEVAQVPYNGAAGSSLLRDDADGIAKIVVDARTHHLLGATFAGPDAAEVVHAATVAIVGEIPTEVLRHAVPSFPTVAELWLRLLEELPREFRRAGEVRG